MSGEHLTTTGANMAGLIQYLIDRSDRQAAQQQYSDLLGSYYQPGDPNQLPIGNTPQELDQSIQRQQGGYRGPGGVLSGGPPQEFYMRAAALPGYQQLAQQAMVGQQAMDRQIQNQIWQQTEIPLAQKATIDAQLQQQQWERDRREFEWTNPSWAQQQSAWAQRQNVAQGWASNNIAQQRLQMEQNNLIAQQQAAQNAQMFPALGLKGNDAIKFRQDLGSLDATANVLTDTIDYLNKVGVGGKALDRGTVNAMRGEFDQNVVNYFRKKFEAGALQESDMKFIEKLAGDPGAWTSLDANQTKLVKRLLTTVEDDRRAMYGYAGVQAPPTQTGRSAWARSASAPSVPKDIEWGP